MPPPSEEEKEKEQNEENELDQIIYTQSPDSGWRLQLNNIVDNLTYLWNERANVFRYEFDILQRPLMEWVDDGAGEKLTTYKVYGDWIGVPNPRQENLKNKEIYNFDQSGALANTQFDFKENLLQRNRQLALNYQNTIDWSLLIGEQTLADLKAAADAELQTEEFQNIYEFDALNRVILKTQPDGSKYSYSFNKAALLEKVATQLPHENSFTDVVNKITYNAREQKTAIYYANGSQTKNTYNQDTFHIIRILTTRNTGQDIMQDLNYTFDAVGNITQQRDDAQQAQYFSNTVIDPTNRYKYDSLYRLVQATGREKGNLPAPNSSGYQPDWIPTNGKSSQSLATYCEQYSYDEVGNILELAHKDTCGGTENWKRSYVYNNNTTNNYLLSAHTGSTPPSSPQFTYDAHGNMLQMPHLQAMNWDFADQMKSSQKTGETTYYVYSGGERIRKIVTDTSGTAEKIKYERIYFGEYEVYHKYNTTGELETETLTHHVKDESLAMVLQEVKTVNEGSPIENPITISRYQYGDQLDSAKLELNHSAEVLSYEEYHPFGTTSFEMHTNNSEVSLKRYKYVQKERDSETGLYYYGGRYYAAWLGRFTACDPLEDKYLGWSPYNYTLNNPVRYTDPTGKGPEDIIIIGKNGKRITISTADDNHRYIYVPFEFEENRNLDLGFSEHNTNNLAVGYSIGVSAEAKATYGGKLTGSATVVNFPTNSEYGDYNYIYGEGEATGSGGAQLGLNANIEANFFIAYSSDRESIKPSYFEGRSSTYGLTADVKAMAGGGMSIYGFQSEDEKWLGIGVGFNLGIGEGLSIAAWTRGESYSVMLSNQKPTSERSFLDRFLNDYNVQTMVGQAIYQYLQKEISNEEK